MTSCPDPEAACGCCEGTEPVTPQSTANRPGLTALAYRIGTHATFLETMKARLSSHCLGDKQECLESGNTRPLAALTTRDDGDAALALFGAWATLADVLTFYQERIANEGYLRTATERRSVVELARLVGYRPRPGVAASVYLAYTIDTNTEEEVVVPSGARVQSVPGPDELPQSFETSEPLVARAAWNRLAPRGTQPQAWSAIWPAGAKASRVFLKGIGTNLKPNDPLLIVPAPNSPQLFRVTAVRADGAGDRTEVAIEAWDTPPATSGFEAVRQVATRLIGSAPEGKMSDRLVENLRVLSEVAARATEEEELSRFLDDETLPLLKSTAESLRLPAQKLRSWLTESEQTLRHVRRVMDDRAAGADAAAADNEGTAFSGRLNALIKRASQPLANALQLPRGLDTSFRLNSDAGYKTLGLAAPDLRESLGQAVAGYEGASPAPTLEVYALRLKTGVFGRNAPKRQRTVRTVTEFGEELRSEPIGEWPIVTGSGTPTESAGTVFLDGAHDAVAPGSWLVLDSSAVTVYEPSEVLVEPAVFPEVRKSVGGVRKYLVTLASGVAKVARAEYGVSGDSVRVDLGDAWLRLRTPEPPVINLRQQINPQARIDRDFEVIRRTAVYAQSERLELAEAPIETLVCGGSNETGPLELDGLYQDLEPGRFVIVSGERGDIQATRGVLATEALMIAEVIHDVRAANAPGPLGTTDPKGALAGDRIHTFILLDEPLSYCYRRDSLKVYGNVVKATHGETRRETLGGGDGAKALQTFTLKQSPLTYLAAPTAVGAESTLQVFINDVRWHEHSSVVDLSPTDRAFTTKSDDGGKTTVTFGNGREGARLPTGLDGVKAVYRNGIGKPGNVRAGQLSQLSTRPLGVKEVINPLRASGGADRETRDQARRHAPLAVMSLDRLVSTADYADFSRSFAGIAKAAAAELSDTRRTVVHVTIAGSDDVPIEVDSDLFANLRRALVDLGDPFQPVELATRDLLLLVLSAGVRIDPDHRWERVVTDIRTTLLDTFGFERRELAQDVTASEVLSTIQLVRGVVYVDLDAFGAVPSTTADPSAEDGRRPLTPEETASEVTRIVGQVPGPRIAAEPARMDASGIRPAQLAVLVPEVPATLILNEIKG